MSEIQASPARIATRARLRASFVSRNDWQNREETRTRECTQGPMCSRALRCGAGPQAQWIRTTGSCRHHARLQKQRSRIREKCNSKASPASADRGACRQRWRTAPALQPGSTGIERHASSKERKEWATEKLPATSTQMDDFLIVIPSG